MNLNVTNILRNHIELIGNLVKQTTPRQIIEFQSSRQPEKSDILKKEAIDAFYKTHINNNFIFSVGRAMTNIMKDFYSEYKKINYVFS